MPCIKTIVQTSQIMWVKRLTNPINAKWKQLSWFLLNIEPHYIFKKGHILRLKKNQTPTTIKTCFVIGMTL